jgi:transposase
MQEQAKLVGLGRMAGSAVGSEMVLPCLDVVLGLAAGAVELLIKVLGAPGFEVGDDEAGIGSLGPDLDAGDDALDPAPTPGSIVELRKATQLAAGRRCREALGRALFQCRDMAQEGRVGGQAENPIDPVRPAPLEHFGGGIMAVGAEQNLDPGPVSADGADQAAHKAANLDPAGTLARPQQRRDKAAFPVEHDDRLKPVIVIVGVKQTQLLTAPGLLSEFYDRIKARDAVAGRPATGPRVVLAVWLFATLEGIGSARAIDRLCQQHAAYRWLCGGAPINHDLLAEFRRENAALLDRLLTQSVTGLIAEKLITLEELMIDGTKVRAYAGRGSLCKRKRLETIEQAVAERVAELKSELDTDPGEQEQRRKKRAWQAAEHRAQRVERARQKLAELEQEKAARAKTHPKEEAEKSEPKVSVSDPEVHSMRLADGAVAPAWNVQVATANGFIVEVDPTDRRRDSGVAPGVVAKVAERCGQAPQRLLTDTTAMTQDDIVKLAEQYPDVTVYSPPPPERPDVKASTLPALETSSRTASG